MEKTTRQASSKAAKQLEKVAQDMDNALRSTGSEFVPGHIKSRFESMAQDLWNLQQQCSNHAEDIVPFTSFSVPTDLSKKLEEGNKSAIVYEMHAKNFLKQRRVSGG